MPIATLPGIIARPITDAFVWEEVFAKYPALKNWWTLTKGQATADATTGRTRIAPRIGTLSLDGTGVQPWIADGGYEAASFAGAQGQPVLGFDTAKLTGRWTMFSVRKAAAIDTEDWGISLRNSDPSVPEGDGARVFHVARNAAGASQVRGVLINPAINAILAYPNAPALNARDVGFVSFDFTTGAVSGAHGAETPTSVTYGRWSELLATSGTVWQWTVGQGQGNQPFSGSILDFALIQGDIFDGTAAMNNLRADLIRYAATYGA